VLKRPRTFLLGMYGNQYLYMKQVENRIKYGLLVKLFPYTNEVIEQDVYAFVWNSVQNVVGHQVVMRFNDLMLRASDENG